MPSHHHHTPAPVTLIHPSGQETVAKSEIHAICHNELNSEILWHSMREWEPGEIELPSLLAREMLRMRTESKESRHLAPKGTKKVR